MENQQPQHCSCTVSRTPRIVNHSDHLRAGHNLNVVEQGKESSFAARERERMCAMTDDCTPVLHRLVPGVGRTAIAAHKLVLRNIAPVDPPMVWYLWNFITTF